VSTATSSGSGWPARGRLRHVFHVHMARPGGRHGHSGDDLRNRVHYAINTLAECGETSTSSRRRKSWIPWASCAGGANITLRSGPASRLLSPDRRGRPLSKADALALCAVGPTAGLPISPRMSARTTPTAYMPKSLRGGHGHDLRRPRRVVVRVKELMQSYNIIEFCSRTPRRSGRRAGSRRPSRTRWSAGMKRPAARTSTTSSRTGRTSPRG